MIMVVLTDSLRSMTDVILSRRERRPIFKLSLRFLVFMVMLIAVAFATPACSSAATPDTSWYSAGPTSFTLTTADQLAGLAVLVNGGNNFSGKTIVLGNNISLSGYQAGSEWTPIGNQANYFCGVFDGMWHKITGLYINAMSQGQGLFGWTYNAVIRNIVIENPNVYCGEPSITSLAGAIVGYLSGGTMENCAVIGGVVTGISNGGGVGGVIGLMEGNGVILNCLSTCDVNGGGELAVLWVLL
jgi:hypothetical protein